MEPARVSGTVTISNQRSHIKIETLRGKNPTEIRGDLSEVCGELTVDRRKVSRSGCVSTDSYPTPGRPRTSTDERSVKFVADALEDRRATCEEIRGTGTNPSQENAQELTSVKSYLYMS